MNILYLHETAALSGAENSLLQLMRFIDRTKYSPLFICPPDGEFPRALAGLGVPVFGQVFPRIRSLRGVVPALRRIRGIIREHNVGVLHAQSIRTDIYASCAAGFLPGKRPAVVWHLRNMLVNEAMDPERMFAFLPDALVCNSHAIAERMRVRSGIARKVSVIYSGVDTDVFSPHAGSQGLREELGIPADCVVVGIASRFHPMKGHEVFLRAAREVVSRAGGTQVRFLIAGSPVFDDESGRDAHLLRLARSLGIEDKVIFAGPRRDMPRVYAALDMLVLSSITEACGRVVLEAMAAGKPVIGTDTGGTPELIKEGVTGYLFEPGDFRRLAELVLQLCRDRNTAAVLGEQARRRACEEFPIAKTAREIGNVYDTVSRAGVNSER